ncbi:MAG: transposase [Acidobacteria bacterium]|nr:transposase [Acidobacteriota bacterium]
MASPSTSYQARQPAQGVLYQVVRDHFETFRAQAADLRDGEGLPRFVEQEFRDFLRCGWLGGGFARFRCTACGLDRLVPFSCRGRGFCPSCGGRRMAERAAHLVDRVFPPVPVRQWVLSLPHRLRYRLAWDHDLCRGVAGAFMRAVLGFLRRQARAAGVMDGRGGAVAIVQRFGGALNLNIHFHALVIDGVFSKDDTRVRFHPRPDLDTADVDEVLATVTAHVRRLLERQGLGAVDEADNAADAWAEDAPVLAGIAAASVQGRVALGHRAGARVRRRGDPSTASETWALGRCHARYDGFDLHAGLLVPAGQRERLERVSRYALRPPVAQDRLSLTPEGQVRLRLGRRWSDGTTHLLFDPVELLERLAVLTPRPRINLILYHGVLAPRAAWRSLVVGFGAPVSPGEVAVADGSSNQSVGDGNGAPRRRVGGRLWADLMARTFGFDVLACPRCGGRLRLIALIEDASVVLRLLQHLGLPTQIPEPYPARAPPLSLDGLAARGAHDDIVFDSRS